MIPRYLSSVPIQFVAQYSQPSIRLSNNLPLPNDTPSLSHHQTNVNEWPQATPSNLENYEHEIFQANHPQETINGHNQTNVHSDPQNTSALVNGHTLRNVDFMQSVDITPHRARESVLSAAARGSKTGLGTSAMPHTEFRHRGALTTVLIALLADLLFTIGAFNRRLTASFHAFNASFSS